MLRGGILVVCTLVCRHARTAEGFSPTAPPRNLLLPLHATGIDLEGKTVVELKEELRSRGLPVSGTKPKLIERLQEYSSSDDDDEEMDEEVEVETEDWSLSADDNDGDISELLSEVKGHTDDSSMPATSVRDRIPRPLLAKLTSRLGDDLRLLPVQEQAYDPIASGSDAVLFAPTGSGKTLGYAIPLLARLLEWKRDGTLKKRRRLGAAQRAAKAPEPARPPILVLAPSRELAKQIGRVFAQNHPASSGRVAAVFGGVPLERHASLLRRGLDVVVGTPGRIRELIREGHMSTSSTKAIVLDEADVLLNFDDQPEIEMLLDGMEEDFQLVLASATVNERVREIVQDLMEMDDTSEGFISVDDDGSARSTNRRTSGRSQAPIVRHWYTAARSSARSGLASDLVATLSPRLSIVFVASKVEVEQVAEEMSERLPDVKTSVLHGDMSQSARSRTIALLRNGGPRRQVLVATDVASRGLDIPGVDLVLQFGVPRQAGKEGTFDRELYTHRSGRAGRFGGGERPADAILLFDPSQGENRVLGDLERELHTVGVHLQQRPLPSPADVMDASYDRAKELSDRAGEDDDFSDFFRHKIQLELRQVSGEEREEELLDRLASAMAALSGLGGAVPERSLLTADTRDRTVRIWSKNGKKLSPPDVIPFAKGLGSGKLGRITILGDGSAVFDLVAKRAIRLVQAADAEMSIDDSSRHLGVELPSVLPEL